jgi:hypothetical protein
MNHVSDTRIVDLPFEAVERALCDADWPTALGAAWPDAAITETRFNDKGEQVERTLRFEPAEGVLRSVLGAERAGWDEESVYNRSARRLEVVHIPHDPRVAAALMVKATVECTPVGDARTQLALEARVRCRVPGAGRFVERALAERATDLFRARGAAIERLGAAR